MKTICIIGAGAAGGFLAGQLSESESVIVKLIDIDGLNGEYDASNKLKSNSVGDYFGTDSIRGFGFGGSSNLWHGVLAKLEDSDLDELDYTDKKELKNQLKKVYQDLDKEINGSRIFENEKLRELNDELNDNIFNLQNYKSKLFVVQRCPFRTRSYLKKSLKKNRIQFYENSVALEIVGDPNFPSKVHKLKIYNKKINQIEYVFADIFVISAGSLETPRILLQSIASKSLILKNNNIGKNLIDHPWCILGEFTSKNSNIKFSKSDIRVNINSRARYGKLLPLNVDNIPTNNCIVLKPYISENYLAFINLLKCILYKFSYKAFLRLIFVTKKHDLIQFLRFLLYEKFALKLKTKKGLVFAYIDQQPSKSCIGLSGVYDKYGRNIPNIDWNITDYDIKIFSTIQKILTDNLNYNNYDFKTFEINKENITTGCHFAGTARIGSSKLNSVIDSNLKMHEIDNVYICDLSIFKNFGNSNPTFTLFAFSRRLANILK